jgi:hypothetical protein
MPNLSQSLQGHDLGHLYIIAQLWEVDMNACDTNAAIEQLTRSILNSSLVTEIVETLPAAGRCALDSLTEQEGRMTWVNFTRHFGEVREMGTGRRDREKPYINPVSAAEMLFYRALLARAFFDTPDGPLEFAYIPDDLLPLLPSSGMKQAEVLGHPAKPMEKKHIIPSNDQVLDEACTLLAALRLGWERPPGTNPASMPVQILHELLAAAELISDGIPQPEPVKTFLEAPRGEALAQLVRAWLESEQFNELHQIPGLICEGEWKNNPHKTRKYIMELLCAVPQEKWWSLAAFVQGIREAYPDFQRPAGDYDSWFIRSTSEDKYLRGFVNWDKIDGALIRYVITGPLHWLGIVALACPAPELSPSAFLITKIGGELLQGKAVPNLTVETGKVQVTSRGCIHVPRRAPRAVRYQIARFCEWEDEKWDEFQYRITPPALEKACEQGLKLEHLLVLLQKQAAAPLPPALVRALKRWGKTGTEARVENQVILRLSDPKVLEGLRKSKANRFLGEPLGPAAVIIHAGASAKVQAALLELGFLAEDTTKADIIPNSAEHH